MADFGKAYDIIKVNEGLFSNNQNDKGGPTIYGVSSRLIESSPLLKEYKEKLDTDKDGVISSDEIKKLTPEEAETIYKLLFWDPNNYGKIWSQALAYQVFDFAITSGSPRANKLLQNICNYFLQKSRGSYLKEDGIVGPKTLSCTNTFSTDILPLYRSRRRNFYTKLAESNPTQERFLAGWLNRVDR